MLGFVTGMPGPALLMVAGYLSGGMTMLGTLLFGRGRPPALLAASECIVGRDTPIPDAPAPGAKHYVTGAPMYGPWDPKYKQAMLGMGCFWCSENLYMRKEGVYSTQVGYAGGVTKNPSYGEVCSGQTNHNEMLRIIYDPEVISFEEILRIFWAKHDPTTRNQQGNDRGTQYRSGIYYYDDEQKAVALRTRDEFQKQIDEKYPDKQISTEIIPAPPDDQFYIAEDYHQQYDAKPGNREYCGLRPLVI
mmetsp:Transcript_102335/g.289827  ORF Transcript_102335/g.289827 Transcript_102335/m.289827 type:complete len:247 (-) Transcript_102335:81-821(-)